VPEEDIDKRYYERPYYIGPDGKGGGEAFAVIRHEGQGQGDVSGPARLSLGCRIHGSKVFPRITRRESLCR
jgi:non-homologous end joining protein Ku